MTEKSNRTIADMMKKLFLMISEMTDKSKRITSAVMKKSKHITSAVTEKRIYVASVLSKKSVLERAKIVEKSRAFPPPFLTGGWSFCMIKKNTFPAGASRINRQKIGAA